MYILLYSLGYLFINLLVSIGLLTHQAFTYFIGSLDVCSPVQSLLRCVYHLEAAACQVPGWSL